MSLIYTSTCFEQNYAHHREVKIVSHSIWHHHALQAAVRCTTKRITNFREARWGWKNQVNLEKLKNINYAACPEGVLTPFLNQPCPTFECVPNRDSSKKNSSFSGTCFSCTARKMLKKVRNNAYVAKSRLTFSDIIRNNVVLWICKICLCIPDQQKISVKLELFV